MDLFAAVQSRRTAMKLADKKGHQLGREYYSDEHEEALEKDALVRGFETDEGKMIVVTDEELESVAPEMTRDIELRVFVAKEDIPPAYFERPYFLAPSGRSQKAYQLLARVMERTGRVGVGTFVMRDHQYLVAISSDGAILRAHTLRFADELRSPKTIGLPKRPKVAAKDVNKFAAAIAELKKDELDVEELSDEYAEAIAELVHEKLKKHTGVVSLRGADETAEDAQEGGGEVIDLMRVLKQRLAAGKGGTPRKPARRTQKATRRKRRAA